MKDTLPCKTWLSDGTSLRCHWWKLNVFLFVNNRRLTPSSSYLLDGMTRNEFNIDEAEDFDDGTRSVLHDDGKPGNDAENQDSKLLCSSRKQRLQTKQQKSGQQQREPASALRVKNWDSGVLESEEYAGRVVERRDLMEDEESLDEDAMAEWSEAEPFGASEEESDEEETEEKVKDEGEIEESEDEDKSAEMLIRGFQKEDSVRLMGAQDRDKVVEKATHVRNQKLIWERCLEVQIYTKRLLTTARDVADQDVTDGETTEEDTVASRKELVVAELYKSIEAVAALQEKLCNVPELCAVEVSMKKRKRSCDDLWQEIATSSSAMLPQYNDILSTYTRKTDLAAGSKNTQAKKFKAVNQDILAQVESVLVDPRRVKRKAHALLDVPEADVTEGGEEQLDELMYDDSDFYQQLLKEFIESGGGGSGQVKRTHRKKNRIVNRKASKGRQLRYTVHPKLENFMFPEPYPRPEMDVTELFRSLFGQVRH
uniref:Apoptosis-antagonizing transcription factor C-terminal domain-containing protein n=1 Tax=Hyaloperonospora arabidopsidis (strain Emoy2) TaxID=559515 RepID=M4C2H0_HYAAE